MTSVTVLVIDINPEGSLEVRVAQSASIQLHRAPVGVQGVLDDLTPVDDGEVLTLDVDPADLKEGVALPEEILVIQVSSLQREGDHIVDCGNLLGVNKDRSTFVESSGESSTLSCHDLTQRTLHRAQGVVVTQFRSRGVNIVHSKPQLLAFLKAILEGKFFSPSWAQTVLDPFCSSNFQPAVRFLIFAEENTGWVGFRQNILVPKVVTSDRQLNLSRESGASRNGCHHDDSMTITDIKSNALLYCFSYQEQINTHYIIIQLCSCQHIYVGAI